MTSSTTPAKQLPHDPLDYETWPEAQKEFAGRVWRGLHDGDLKPLSEYLRAGHYIHPALGLEIADAIDGEAIGFFHIVARGRRPGQRGFTQSSDEHDRKMQIGVFMEEHVRRYGHGGYDSALKDTCTKFGIKSSATVTKARRYVLDYMATTPVRPGHDLWEMLKQFYFTP